MFTKPTVFRTGAAAAAMMLLATACGSAQRPAAPTAAPKPTQVRPALPTLAPTKPAPTAAPTKPAPTALSTKPAPTHSPPALTATPVAAASLDIVDTLISTNRFKTLTSALQSAGLTKTLKGVGPYTIFAPTDEAFARIDRAVLDALMKPESKAELMKLLTHHVVSGTVMSKDVVKLKAARTVDGDEAPIVLDGKSITIGGVKVIETDVATRNGVIHIIDGVMMPASIDVKKLTAVVGEKDIVDTAAAAGSFTVLEKVLKASGLTELLKGKGPYTIFAPTDAAFAKLNKQTLDDLLKPQNKAELIRVLKYHVVPGKVLARDASKMTAAKTEEGASLTIKSNGTNIKINDATVTQADIPATNGVIQGIDTVLIPPKAK